MSAPPQERIQQLCAEFRLPTLTFIFVIMKNMKWLLLLQPRSPISMGGSIPLNWPGNFIPKAFLSNRKMN